jgi:exonuclease SbcD
MLIFFGKAIYQLNVVVNSDQLISEQDILQVHEMISDFEENELRVVLQIQNHAHFLQNHLSFHVLAKYLVQISIDQLSIKNKYEDQNTLVKEFSPELIDDTTVYDGAMKLMYFDLHICF